MASIRVAEEITELVGNTPILHLRKLSPAGGADVYAKLEYLNPGGSIKDRAALGMITKAGARRPSETGRDHLRSHCRQYRSWPGAHRRWPRIQDRARRARRFLAGKMHADGGAGRGGDSHSQGRWHVGGDRLCERTRRPHAQLLHRRPIRKSRQSRLPLRDHRPRVLRSDWADRSMPSSSAAAPAARLPE